MAAPPIITYDKNGFPIELISEKDWRRAIARGHIVPGTPVTVFRAAAAGQMMSAADVPELMEIFAEFAPSPIEPEPPVAEPGGPPASAAASFARSDETAPDSPTPVSRPWSEVPNPVPPTKSPFEYADATVGSPPAPAIPAGMKAAGWLLAFLIVLALLGRCGSTSPDRDEPEANANYAASDQPLRETPQAAPTFETSFDCRSASMPAERSICGSRELAAQDREVARLYAAAMGRRAAGERDALQQDQQEWLARRNVCAEEAHAESCLSRIYVERIGALQIARLEREVAENAADTARSPEGAAERQRPVARSSPPDSILCVLPDGAEARIPFDQCRQRSGVVMPE